MGFLCFLKVLVVFSDAGSWQLDGIEVPLKMRLDLNVLVKDESILGTFFFVEG
jgi:hypothetical protein